MISEKDIKNPVYVLTKNNTTISLVTLLSIKRDPNTNLQTHVTYRDHNGNVKQIDSDLCFEYEQDLFAYKKNLKKLALKKPYKGLLKSSNKDTKLMKVMYDFLKFISDADWIDLGDRKYRTELHAILKKAKKHLNIKE